MIKPVLKKLMAWGLARGQKETKVPFAYVIKSPHDGTPYMYRFLGFRLFKFRPMLHNIAQADQDRDPHNHPWDWSFSLILSGSYTEERMVGNDYEVRWMKQRKVNWFNFIRANDYHRIVELHGDVWTLFFAGKRTQDWGFMTPYGYVPHEEYLKGSDNVVAEAKALP